MRLPRPAPFVCRACSHRLRAPSRPHAPLSRSSLGVRHASSGSSAFPFRVAVIGSGPAGFYSAYRLMSKLPRAHVDMYEQQPVPYGLVRFGVAPDHPEVKYCQEKFEEVAASARFTFIGNVQVGHHLPLSALADHYDAILFAYGASKDQALNIPGEDLDGVYSARAFVGWYNGLPEYADLDPALDTAKDAVIVGQGNVALDVARILLSNVDELRKTDITEHALEKLSRNKIDSIRIVGRRGPMQAAYTIKEIRELFNLPNVFFNPIPSPLFPPPEYKLNRQMKRLTKILQEGSPNGAPPQDPPPGTKQWTLNHFLAPAAFRAATRGETRINNATFRHTSFRVPLGGGLVDPFDRSATVEPSPGGYTTSYPADIAFRSVGYKAEPLPGFEDLGIPFFHHNGTIPQDGCGRVAANPPVRRVQFGRPPTPTPDAPGVPVGPPNSTIPDPGNNDPATTSSFDHLPGIYVAGWVKRGPTGVILTTMQDAFTTADSIIADWGRARPFLPSDARGWKALRDRAVAAGARPVSWEDWKRIDTAERERGKEQGRVRAKFVRTEDMLKVLDG